MRFAPVTLWNCSFNPARGARPEFKVQGVKGKWLLMDENYVPDGAQPIRELVG